VLFLADDLGWKDTGYQGSEGQTPNIDRLCQQGVRFDRLYAFPLCSPTRSALMTGRNPVRLGLGYTVVRPWSTYGLPTSETTMADIFRAAGYQTAAIGKWHLGHTNIAHLPRSRGFDHFYGHLNGAIDYFTHERDGGSDWQRDGVSIRQPGYTTDLLASGADRWIAARDKQRPFFLYMPWNAPHGPLQAPADLMAKYASVKDPKRQTYLAMVDALDRGIGRVIQRLEQESVASETLVLFLSDNGGPRSSGADNGPLRSGKSNVFEGGIRVPGLAWWPGRLKPGACNQLMTVYDILPTISTACGIPCRTRQPLDGLDFWPAVSRGAPPSPRQNLLFAVQPDRGPRQHALRDGPWKLIRIGQTPCDTPVESLFQVEDDPNEKRDLIQTNPDVASRLRRMMDDWIRLAPTGEASYSLEPHPGWVTPKDWSKVAVE
jgi:arylsulfatase A-like enzyme